GLTGSFALLRPDARRYTSSATDGTQPESASGVSINNSDPDSARDEKKGTSVNIFRQGLGKTRQSFFGRLQQALGGTTITDETWDDLEAGLVQSDVGVATTQQVIKSLRDRYRREGMTRPDQLRKALKEELRALLKQPATPNISGRELSVILIVGV